ncbi:hypothetical protein HGRIS_008002 [Hohenbuehelia grisea]|uniref:RNase III domain-containing protein n=1 Tax=Hohenbuehelia grisea TaxID=104357 RepID=A0ABR3J712_9AGAR
MRSHLLWAFYDALKEVIYSENFTFDLPHLSPDSWEPLTCNLDKHRERLEFLGDSIIASCISAELYRLFPNKGPGFYTAIKSAGDAFEMVIGAHFEEFGFDSIRQWTATNFQPLLIAVGTACDKYIAENPSKNKALTARNYKGQNFSVTLEALRFMADRDSAERRGRRRSAGSSKSYRSRSLPPAQRAPVFIDLTILSDSDEEETTEDDHDGDSMDVDTGYSANTRPAAAEDSNGTPHNSRKKKLPLSLRLTDPDVADNELTVTPLAMPRAASPECRFLQRLTEPGEIIEPPTTPRFLHRLTEPGEIIESSATPRAILRAMSLRPPATPSVGSSKTSAVVRRDVLMTPRPLSFAPTASISRRTEVGALQAQPVDANISLGSADHPIEIDVD